MREKFTGLFCALIVILFWVSSANASPFHHHEKKSPKIESHKAQHVCPLNHHQRGLPCPHDQSNKDNEGYRIAVDCGGGPVGSNPTSLDYSNNLFSISDSSFIQGDDKADGLIINAPHHKFSLAFQLDHPPKSL